jgi:glycine hydroxymethyltransferase
MNEIGQRPIETRQIDQKPISDYEVQDLLDLLERQEKWFDQSCLVMYAASNHLSSAQRRMLGSTIASRVAEGDVGKKFYQMGTEFLDEFERVAVEGLKELYGSQWADCRIQSGTLANIAVELGTTRPGDTIMSISLSAGSHTSHTSVGFPVFYGLNIVDIPFDDENVNVDLDRLESVLKKQEPKPKLLILGGSLFLFHFPVKEVRALLDRYSPETVLLFDAAHVDGLIVGGAYPNPLLDGADIISGSTYKTFGGPPGGFVVGNSEELYKKVKRAIYPGITTSYHYNRVGALAVTCLNLLKHAKTYTPQIIKNAQALGAALDARGVNIVGRDLGYTQTHQVLIYTSEGDDMRSKEAGALLADANIITSPQLMPSEARKAVRNPRGIRIGTQELTRLGMKEKEMQVAADFIADVLIDKKAPSEIAPQVTDFRVQFPGPLF